MNTSLALLVVPVAITFGYFAGRTVEAPAQPIALQEQEGEPTELQLRLTQPGEHHKVLDVLVGTFDAQVSYFAPGAPEPFVFPGEMKSRWVMGGRFVEQRFTAEFGGEAFEGMALLGYSGGDHVYEQSWIDTASTQLAYSVGSASPDGLNLEMHSREFDQETGRAREVVERTQFVSKDEIKYERWNPSPDGNDTLAMSIVYKRRAAAAGTR